MVRSENVVVKGVPVIRIAVNQEISPSIEMILNVEKSLSPVGMSTQSRSVWLWLGLAYLPLQEMS